MEHTRQSLKAAWNSTLLRFAKPLGAKEYVPDRGHPDCDRYQTYRQENQNGRLGPALPAAPQ
jgi:hypothetical protein